MVRSSSRTILTVMIALSAIHTTSAYAQAMPIERRLPGIMPRWTEQSDKKIRYAGYSLWVCAFDSAVRNANAPLCGAAVARAGQLGRIPGADGAQVAWRTGSAREYDWLIAAPYYAGDVVWTKATGAGGLRVGDVVVQYRTHDATSPPSA